MLMLGILYTSLLASNDFQKTKTTFRYKLVYHNATLHTQYSSHQYSRDHVTKGLGISCREILKIYEAASRAI